MSEFTSHPPGTPCWVDLMSPDIDGSKSFYTAVFGWDADDQLDDDGNRIYVMFSQGRKSVAGLGGQRSVQRRLVRPLGVQFLVHRKVDGEL